MSVVHDLYCRACDRERKNQRVDVDRLPACACGEPMRIDMSGIKITTDGDYQVFAPGIDTDRKMSLREARSKAKALGMELNLESAEKVGGARNESHRNLGRLYSGTGVRNRSSYDRNYGAFS